MLRPFAPTADDVRLLYLAAALAPDLRRTWVDKKGKAHPYATIVARDYLKVRPLHMGKPGPTPRLTACSSSCRDPPHAAADVDQGHCEHRDHPRGRLAMAGAPGRPRANVPSNPW